jgi:hypothetical protein
MAADVYRDFVEDGMRGDPVDDDDDNEGLEDWEWQAENIVFDVVRS